MSIESDLRKDGITVIEPLDALSINTIAQNVSQKITEAFPNFGFTFDELYNRFSSLPMYIANIPEGMSEASYFYKNSAIYFRDGMGLSDLEKYAVHELIHNLQERKTQNGNLLRLGLCSFKGSKHSGMALNEAAVQFTASNIIGATFENVTYYGISFSTISPSSYPLLCNLIAQMAYITGEETLFDSTLNSNDYFKNKFSSLCGEGTYNQVSNYFDKILDIEEKIILLRNKSQDEDIPFSKYQTITNKIDDLKSSLRKTYFETQELIIKSYFTTVFKSLITSRDIDNFRKSLFHFQELIGTTSNYRFFNNFYIDMMEKIDKKFDSLSDLSSNSTYLITRSTNKFVVFINYIRKLILKKQFENNKE